MHVWPEVEQHSDVFPSRHWVVGPNICPPRIDGCYPMAWCWCCRQRVWCWLCDVCAPAEILSSWHRACLDQGSLYSPYTRISWLDMNCCQPQGEVWHCCRLCCHWYSWPPCQPQQPPEMSRHYNQLRERTPTHYDLGKSSFNGNKVWQSEKHYLWKS